MSFVNAELLGRVKPHVYHAEKGAVERGTPGFVMSPSALKDFMWCPSRWKAGYVRPESRALRWGNILDTLVLTREWFEELYAVQPETIEVGFMVCPKCGSEGSGKTCRQCKVEREYGLKTIDWDNRRTACSDWIAEQQGNGITVISRKELADANAAFKRLCDDATISGFLNACDRQILVKGEWRDADTGLSIPVSCLIDLVGKLDGDYPKSLGDLKTANTAHPSKFGRNIFNFGYHIQAAWDMDLYVAATGEDRTEWQFIVSESYEPWEPGRELLSQDFLEMGRRTYKAAMSLYARCVAENKWPGYDAHPDSVGGWSIARPEPWMDYDSLSKAMAMSFQGEDEPEQAYEPEDVYA